MIQGNNALKALLVAFAIGMSGFASAQATDGGISGNATAGETIIVKGDNGITREIEIEKTGKFNVRHLPIGNYNVIRVDAEGNVVQTQATQVVVGRTSPVQ